MSAAARPRGAPDTGDRPRVRIHLQREPGRVARYRQELIRDDAGHKITLLRVTPDAAPLEVAPGAELPAGSTLLWHTFPGRPFEVAACHGPDGEPVGHYTNLVRPPEVEGDTWEIQDLWLDVWQPAGDGPRLLDEDELRSAEAEGWISAEEAGRVRELGERIRRLAAAGAWPPPDVRGLSPDALPALRLRRDQPGAYHANRVTSRVIAYGMYCFGAFCATTALFAGLTGALSGDPAAGRLWLATLGAEALVLLPLALTGSLPATRRVHPREAISERSLVAGAVLMAAAVLLVHDSRMWEVLLAGVNGVLAAFLAVFAASRAYHDRQRPALALGGLAISLFALGLLI